MKTLMHSLLKPWAIQESELKAFLNQLKSFEAEKDLEPVPAQQPVSVGNIYVIPVRGVLIKYSDWMETYGWATSYQTLTERISFALSESSISTIVLHIDSPGGDVDGLVEFTNFLKAVSREKPVYAHISGTGASAAYWIATAARYITATEGSYVGSVGCMAVIYDDRKFWADWGIDELTFVSSLSPDKNADVQTDRGKAIVQEMVDECAKKFVDTIVANRYIAEKDVLEKFGKGRVLNSANALHVKMIDGVTSMSSLTQSIMGGTLMFPRAEDGQVNPDENQDTETPPEDTQEGAQDQAEPDNDECTCNRNNDTQSEDSGDGTTDENTDQVDDETSAVMKSNPIQAQKLIELGASRERKRIAELDQVAKAYPFHKELLAKAKVSGMTAGDFLVAVVKNDQEKARAKMNARVEDAKNVETIDPSRGGTEAEIIERYSLDHAKTLNRGVRR